MSRIAIFAGYSPSLINFRLHLIKAWQEAGCEVLAIAPDFAQYRAVEAALEAMGVSCFSVPMAATGLNPMADLKSVWRLYRLLQKLKVDKILCYTIKPVIYGSIAAHFARVKDKYAMITGLGHAFSGGGFKAKLLAWVVKHLYKFALAKTTLTFFQNRDDQALFMQLKIVSSNKTELINGSGVDLAYFKEEPLPNKPAFLLIARLLIEKGVREYISAARELKAKYPDAVWYLVGGEVATALGVPLKEINAAQLEGVVQYLGQLNDVRSALRESSVFVLPSTYREGVPRSILEALAMGRPVITTDTPGCRETVLPGRNGYLVSGKDVSALAGAMEAFIINPTLAQTMGAESRKIAEDKFDVYKVNKVILQAMGLMSNV